MPRHINLLYCSAWILYAVFVLVTFPLWHLSVAIPHFILLAIGAWVYGTSRGLLIIIPSMIFHMYLLSHLYADIFNWYQTKITSPLLDIVIVELVGNLRIQLDRLKMTKDRLDQLVDRRNNELAVLTEQLLKSSEEMKNANGQELHDGIGQQLTGVQLLSSSLFEHLLNENDPAASIALHLKNQTSKTHHHIRKISRLLFPVRIGQVGLIPALNELSACMNDIKPVRFEVVENHELPPLPEDLQLQLFRICQETALYLTDHLEADCLSLTLTNEPANVVIKIAHNGNIASPSHSNGFFRLIRYRLKQIGGKESHETKKIGKQLTTFSIPLPPIPA